MAEITVEIEIDGELKEGDEYGIQDAIADALRALGYNVRSVKAS